MKFLMNFLLVASVLITHSINIMAEENAEENAEEKAESSNVIRGGMPLTEEEIKLPQQTSFNSLWIILFTFFYINYKLNQFLELEEKTK